MRNLLVILGLILTFGFTSCTKPEDLPQPMEIEEVETVDETISVFGEWVLIGGNMYLENLETGETTVIPHFGGSTTVSSLRYEGSLYDIEDLVVNTTTWTFIAPPSIPNTGEFWLNNDSANPYGLNLTSSNMTIVENSTGTQKLGGSARPLSAYSNGIPNQANFYIQETYTSINGANYKYYNELTFEKI
jgi:hypothetical protein